VLPSHANGMALEALNRAGEVVACETFYSFGGGFVVAASDDPTYLVALEPVFGALRKAGLPDE
jgi:hypothetical protein